MDGATCTANAAVSSAPRPTRPAMRYAVISMAAQVPIRTTDRGFGRPRQVSSTASVPARKVAEDEGTSAVQYRSRVK